MNRDTVRSAITGGQRPAGRGPIVRALRPESIAGALVTPALLAVLTVAAGIGPVGWAAGLASGWGITALLALARRRTGRPAIGPADWVTLGRALLIAGVAALVADAFVHPAATTALVVIGSVALALDAVDGQVARRTGTASPLGARFDGEVDAYLIAVLSIQVARDYGPWVLAIGAARYAFLLAGWVIRWLAAPLPPRYWRKIVAATQGVVLVVAASGLPPRPVGMVAVGAAMVLLAESFGRDVLWLYRRGVRPGARRVVRRCTTVAALVLAWAVLVAPDQLQQFSPAAFLRIPIEALVLVALAVLLPVPARRVLGVAAGVLIALLALDKALTIGFYAEVGRPFNPVLDWVALGPAVGVLRDSIGSAADTVVVLVLLGAVLLAVLVTAAVARICAVAAGHRRGAARGLAISGAAWAICAMLAVQLTPAGPVASTSATRQAIGQVRSGVDAAQDRARFGAMLAAADPYAGSPAGNLLTGLAGRDVLIVFVESYGQVAVQGSTFSPGVDDVLRTGTATLASAGFQARSAFLTSPTFGGISWLAHSTLQSGLWVDSQQRYDQLVASDRFTLSDAFARAGWRTVSDVPADDRSWPQGTSFYHYDRLYDRRDVGYHGPTFSYSPIPDQYTLAAFQRLELQPGHRPVMAEIDLTSSHTPWTPLPHLVSWDRLGDGSIFDSMPAQGLSPDVAWRDTGTVQRLYGQSIQYSLRAFTSWVARLHDDNLVVVLLGDHQPATIVSGAGANHLVPTAVIAHDPVVLDRISCWNWQDGLLPAANAPVWSMDAFRDRFLDAFGGVGPGTSDPPVCRPG